MKILALDDEKPALNRLVRVIEESEPDAEIRAFSRVSAALAEVREQGYLPDVAFLDIEMPGSTGLEVAATLKSIHPNVNIVFVTGYSHYAINALKLRPSGYVVKPATKESITAELQNLRNPPKKLVPAKRVRIQCFGTFAVFVDGEPMHFGRSKSKELLAYLVDRRGAECTSASIADALWEDGIYDRSRQQQLSKFRIELVRSLEAVGAEDILCISSTGMAVVPDRFDCDYYDALAGDVTAINSFIGEYMQPYVWAEFTEGELTEHFRGELY